jgi:GNAT superfamily N-acetyltransferase
MASAGVVVRPMQDADVDAADGVMRLAFGTYLGAPDPLAVFGDREFVRPRYAAAPESAFVAELDGEVVGSNLATRWGSFGHFGPLTVRPELWDRGIASALIEPVIEKFDQWRVRQAALFTFPQSPRHVGLYQKFGFWPQQLTALLEKRVASHGQPAPATVASGAPASEWPALLRACRELTGTLFDGLDLEHEIRAADALGLGDTVYIDDGIGLGGFAVCHLGAGEAGSGACYVKFAAARPGPAASERFERLLDACEALAAARGLANVVAGVNTARHDAYRRLLARGYRTWLQGVIMQRPNDPGYCRPDVYAIDDLR